MIFPSCRESMTESAGLQKPHLWPDWLLDCHTFRLVIAPLEPLWTVSREIPTHERVVVERCTPPHASCTSLFPLRTHR